MRRITFWLAIILIFIVPWEDSISIPALGSLAKLIGFMAAAFWMATILMEGRFQKPHLFHALVLLFFIWNFVSVFWSLDIDNTIQRIKTYSQIFLLLLICWEVFQKEEDLMVGLQAFVLGGYVLVVSTIYNYMVGSVAVQYEGRYSATGVNANDVALILILGLPIGLPIAMQLYFAASRNTKRTLRQMINLLYIPLSIFSIILTGSRTSLIAIIPFVIFMIGTQQIKAERKSLVLLVLLVSLLVLLPFTPQSVINRLGTIGSSIGEGDLGGRTNLWWEAIALLTQHPIFGIGSGAIISKIGSAVHNTFISIAAETGFIGFVLFLSILALVVYRAARLPKANSGFWLVIFITWAIGVLSLSWEFRKLTWLILSFIVIEGSFTFEQLHIRQAKVDVSKNIKRFLNVNEPEIKIEVG